MVNEPILRALTIPLTVPTHLSDVPLVIRESQKSLKVLKKPVALVIPPYVMDEVAM
jgi:hypothetical protein